MIDTSNIDIKAVIDQLCSIKWTGKSGRGEKAAWKGGPCPFCGQGTDRFAVFADTEHPSFYCGIHGNGCKAQGDVITFVQLLHGYEHQGQAIRELQEMGFVIGDSETPRLSSYRQKKESAPSTKWQDSGKALVHAAEKYLWSPVGKSALEYLHKRGLTDDMIQFFHIGYWPKWTEYQREDWGLEPDTEKPTFKIPQGITIPTFEGNTLWKINIRLSPKYIARKAAEGKNVSRYMQVKGSQNGLFNVDAIEPGHPVFMTEGEFDAILGKQQTGSIFVATGGTNGAMMTKWVARLSLASHIILAFDNDGGKGEASATEWTKIFQDKAAIWLPTAKKDITDMWLQKQDIKQWASNAIKLISPVPAIEETPRDTAVLQSEETPIEEFHDICCMCLDENRETIATFVGPDDFMYCQQHWALSADANTPHEDTTCLESTEQKTHGDYWGQLYAKLERRGYFERFERENAKMMEEVRNRKPRKYASPVPKFEWIEDENGKKRLVQAGFWDD